MAAAPSKSVRACVSLARSAGSARVRESAARHSHASLLAGARSRPGTGVCFLRADAGLKKELVARLAEADVDSPEASPELALSANANRDLKSASPRASPRKAAQTSPRKGAPASPRATATAPPASLKGRLADRAHALARASKEAKEGEEEDSDEKEEEVVTFVEEDAQVSGEDEDSEDSEEEDEEVQEEEGEPATASTGGGVMAPEKPTVKQVLKKLSFFHKGTGGGSGGGGGEGGGRGEVGGGGGVGAGLGSVVARSLLDFEMAGGDGKGKRVSMWAAASAAPSSSHALAQEVGLKSGLRGNHSQKSVPEYIYSIKSPHADV